MKILYLHQYFKTPLEPGGTRSYWIAKELISRGHEVIIISANNKISKRQEQVIINGMKVIYLRVPYDNTMGVFRRLVSFFHFMISSTIVALSQKNVNLVIATSTPLTIGFPALILKHFKDIPYLFEVRDLWPEVPIQMGVIKNSIIKWVAINFEQRIYKNAIHIVALSPGMQQGIINKGIVQEKVCMIPNMAKIDKFIPRKIDLNILKKYNLPKNVLKIIHFGAMGQANGLDYIIDAAIILKLKEIHDIVFVFVGEGAVESKLKQRVKNSNLQNVFFLGKHPMFETAELVNCSDMSIVTFANISILATNSPNKFFDSLSAGKPIIVNSKGWTKDIVEQYNCGIYVNPTNPNELVEKLIHFKTRRLILEEMGINARKLAESTYDKSILCKKFADTIDSLHH